MKVLALIFSLPLLLQAAALPKGISAWAYNQSPAIDAAVTNYNASAHPDAQFKYFFPYFGWISIGNAGSQDFDLGVAGGGPAMVSHYEALLPGAMMMPLIDSSDGAAFSSWSAADMRDAADSLAVQLTTTAAALGNFAGVQLDIEPYDSSHLVFYSRLRQHLNAHGLLLTLFTGASNNSALFSAADIVVYSGYDLGTFGMAQSPGSFGALLENKVSQLLASATGTGGKVLVGVPLIASTSEFEGVSGGSCATRAGHTQSDYVAQSAAVLCRHKNDPALLGASIWALGANAQYGPAPKCSFSPASPAPASWAALAAYPSMTCAGAGAVPSTGAAFKVLAAMAAPNPLQGMGSLYFSFDGDADSGELEVYSPAGALVWKAPVAQPDLYSGRHGVAFDAPGLSNGLYYFVVRAQGADGAKSSKAGTFLVLK